MLNKVSLIFGGLVLALALMAVSSSPIGGEENDAALGLDDLVDDAAAFSIERQLKGCHYTCGSSSECASGRCRPRSGSIRNFCECN